MGVGRLEVGHRGVAGRDADRPCPGGERGFDVERRVADQDGGLAAVVMPVGGPRTLPCQCAEAKRDVRLAELKNPAPGTTVVITDKTLNRLEVPVQAARRRLAAARDTAGAVPAKIPLKQHNPTMVRLDTETKLITHAVRMAAFNAEVTLARALHGHYARAGDEAAALVREALQRQRRHHPRRQRPDRPARPAVRPPRRTRALAALCQQLNTTAARYPGASLTLRYEVKNRSAQPQALDVVFRWLIVSAGAELARRDAEGAAVVQLVPFG